uniref:Fibronectin type-III domain-containing protein n=1 Tax=Magallana gigas TaxID=29159 RepID=A0A8W8LP76_MAGGI
MNDHSQRNKTQVQSTEGAHLSWEPPQNTAGKITEYSVYLAVRNAAAHVDQKPGAPAQPAFTTPPNQPSSLGLLPAMRRDTVPPHKSDAQSPAAQKVAVKRTVGGDG